LLFRIEQNPAAIFAAYEFFSCSDLRRGSSRHFHVAASTNAVLNRNDSRIAFAFEETFEATKQILIDFPSQLGALRS
jgi:hypothetical protein